MSRFASRRAWSRRFSLAGAALLAAGVLLVAPSAVRNVAPSAHAEDCPDVSVTFARGTDEPNGLGRVGDALVDSLRRNTGKKVDGYGVNYRATLFQIHGNDGDGEHRDDPSLRASSPTLRKGRCVPADSASADRPTANR